MTDEHRKTLQSITAPVAPAGDKPATINQRALLDGWDAYRQANLALIERFEEAMGEMRKLRQDNRRTRVVVWIVGTAIVLAAAFATWRGAQVLKATTDTRNIAIAAGDQLAQIKATLGTVVESVTLTNEAALLEGVAVEQAAQAAVPGAEPAPPPEAQPEVMSRRLAAQKRAVEVLQTLGGSAEVKQEATARLVELQQAVQSTRPDASLPLQSSPGFE